MGRGVVMVSGHFSGSSMRLGELLVEMGRLKEQDLTSALREYPKGGQRIGEYLVHLGLITEADVLWAMGKRVGIPLRFIDLKKTVPTPEALGTVPESWARKYHILPLFWDRDSLTVATAEPWNYEALQEVSFLCGREVVPLAAPPRDIGEAIQYYYDLGTFLKGDKVFGNTVGGTSWETSYGRPARQGFEREVLGQKAQAPPIIQLADWVLRKGIERRASDIHVESSPDALMVRLRVDGVLFEDSRLPLGVHAALISRLKIMAGLDISERRLPQDGTIRMRIGNGNVDFRLSTLPTQYGEKMAIRILESSRKGNSLEDVGLSEEDYARVGKLIQKQKGIILVTGPTGSGKTTTLYAIIQRIGSPRMNLVTVEDPVEYNMPGVNQVQVRPDIGLDFAVCLRAILRQDPDVILVGEIRDRETAEIAFRAAMTGHLVLSTLHTNDAVSTVTRLMDLGIPRYVVASTVEGIISQRLVRQICRRCSGSSRNPVIREDRAKIGGDCPFCRNEGYAGRIGLFEVLPFTDALRDLVASGQAEGTIRIRSTQEGMTTLMMDGLRKIGTGQTTQEEVRRVVEYA
ncbi:MAG: Flp pilus assembly complex ATPase component TadA [Nitrospirae bacterium]|nr:Flp pilus assembly complex ATPase component TadA [Nitrospirota bacterium]